MPDIKALLGQIAKTREECLQFLPSGEQKAFLENISRLSGLIAEIQALDPDVVKIRQLENEARVKGEKAGFEKIKHEWDTEILPPLQSYVDGGLKEGAKPDVVAVAKSVDGLLIACEEALTSEHSRMRYPDEHPLCKTHDLVEPVHDQLFNIVNYMYGHVPSDAPEYDQIDKASDKMWHALGPLSEIPINHQYLRRPSFAIPYYCQKKKFDNIRQFPAAYDEMRHWYDMHLTRILQNSDKEFVRLSGLANSLLERPDIKNLRDAIEKATQHSTEDHLTPLMVKKICAVCLDPGQGREHAV